MHADEYRFDSHDGLRLFARVYPGPAPEAPVVVCLHGLMRTGRDFEDLAPHLAQRYRVVVPDVRGRGLSARDPRSENYQIPIYLRDLELLLKGLGIANTAIVGTSMGGLMAMVFGAMQPMRVTRIVLNDVGPEVDPKGLERIRGYAGRSAVAMTWSEAADQLRTIFASAWPDIDSARWAVLARRSYRENAQGKIEPDADARIGDVLRASASSAANLWSLWEMLGKVPILVLRGATSDVLSEATLARMLKSKPGLKSIIVPNRGHVPLDR